MKIKSSLWTGVLSLFLFSCEKAVDLKLNDVEPKLVVEATIENGQAPVVILSRSLAYFSAIDLPALSNSFVRDAEVYVSNGTLVHRLKEYSRPVDATTNFYYYSIDSANLATAFTGVINGRYSLRIVWQGGEYTAQTSIPDTTRRIDSLFSRPAPAGIPEDRAAMVIKATDRPGLGDYIRYFTRRNRELFYPGINSVFDDQVIDGTTYTIQVDRGIPRGTSGDEQVYFFKGDTATLKLCNIDKATYDFWRTMEFTYASVGNPFASPTKVLSNINGNALGYFGGYAAQYRTIIIPQ
jgi:hypothetical protein